jgi:exopolysaccharide biosynthesis polyprenyl glycosylphosphotransferase
MMNRATASNLEQAATRAASEFRASTGREASTQLISRRKATRLTVHVLITCLAALLADLIIDGSDGATVVWLMPPLILIMLAVKGSYRRSLQLEATGELVRDLAADSLALLILISAAAILDADSNPAPMLLVSWAITGLLMCASVPILLSAERRTRRAGTDIRRTLVVGAGVVGTQIERQLNDRPELGLEVVGFIDADPVPQERVPDRQAPVLGHPDEFVDIANATEVEHVILTFTSSPDRVLVPLIRACEERGIHVSLVPRMFESVNLRVSLDNIGPLPLLNLSWVDPKGWQFAIKHAIDRVASGLLIVLLSPILAGLAIAVKLSSPGPILYKQLRIGRDGRRFDILKFRSMRIEEDDTAPLDVDFSTAPGGVEGVDRRTPIGSYLRRYSLDELPQLFNVFLGQMSLIGPRPERPEFVEVFDEEVRRYSDRHRVKSGITGLAQVSGLRGNTSLPARVELDNYYIQNWSMYLDLRIAIRTLGAVVEPAE